MALPGLWLPPGFRGRIGPAIRFPYVAGSVTSTGISTSSRTFNTPSESLQGDLQIIYAIMGAGASRSVLTPAGWMQVFTHTGSGNQRRVGVFARAAPADGAQPVTVQFSNTGVITIRCFTIRDASKELPAYQYGTSSSVSSGTMPSLSPAWGVDLPTMWIASAASLNTAAIPAEFSGWDNYALVEVANASGNQLRMATLEELASSKTPPDYSGGSSTNWSLATMGVPGFVGDVTPSVPDAFGSGNWSAYGTDDAFYLNILSFPNNNGALIYGFQYRLDGGAWTSLSGPENFIGCLPGYYAVEIRGVNSAGYGPASDVKYVTVTHNSGGGGGGE